MLLVSPDPDYGDYSQYSATKQTEMCFMIRPLRTFLFEAKLRFVTGNTPKLKLNKRNDNTYEDTDIQTMYLESESVDPTLNVEVDEGLEEDDDMTDFYSADLETVIPDSMTTPYTREQIEQLLKQEVAEYAEVGYSDEAEAQASLEAIRIADSIQTAEIEAKVKRDTRARMLKAQAASTSVNGSYFYESSQATYRLRISNGRWSLSTAIKVSGMGSSEYSNGIEVDGTLYMGGASVGSANGRCARVGRSPQMRK